MANHRKLICVATTLLLLGAVGNPGSANAQAAATTTANSVSLDRARELTARAVAEAHKNGWSMAIAVVDNGGHVVLLERMDQTQVFSVQIAIDKARTANGLKRSTKALEDAVAAGRTAILTLAGVVAVEGGLPIVVDGSVVGAIGVSGATSAQDGVVAAAALNTR